MPATTPAKRLANSSAPATNAAEIAADSSQAPAVDRALDILEHLASTSQGATLSELSETLSLPKNAIFRITKSLADRGYISREESTLRYSLTGKMLALGQPRSGDKTLTELALPTMRQLRDECRETVQLGIRSGHGGVVLEKLEGLFPLRISVEVGLRFKLHNNAPGKVLLAHLSAESRQATLGKDPLEASTERTITDREELSAECDRVLRSGYSTDYAEADDGIHCIAAPIIDRHQELAGVIWISAPARRLTKEQFAMRGRQVKAAAAEISQRLQG